MAKQKPTATKATRPTAPRAARPPAAGAAPARVAGAQAGAARVAGTHHAGAWTFLTNHSHVLLCLAKDPEARLRDVAARVGITERAVQKIVADLEAGGVLERAREGRRNRYTIDPSRPLRHPVEAHRTVATLLDMIR